MQTTPAHQNGLLERRPWLAALLVVAVGALAYSNSMDGVFQFDDHVGIVGNETIRALSAPQRILFGHGRTLTDSTFALNHAIGGFDVFGYHVVNLAIHLAAALALFDLVRELFRHEKEPWQSRATALALTCAALWAVHPLQTECVTYIVQRAESLMALFYLLTLSTLVRGAGSGRRLWYVASIAFCALGMKSKEVMVTAPLVALAIDRVFLAASWRELVRDRGLYYLGLFATLGLLSSSITQAFTESRETATAGFNTARVSAFDYAISQPEVILSCYARLVVIPYPLCLDRDWPAATSLGAALPYVVLLAAVGAAIVWALFRCPKIGVLGLCVFLILAPTSSVMPIADLAAERRMYLPLAPLIVLAVVAVFAAISRSTFFSDSGRARAATGMAIGATLVFVVLTLCRNIDYGSEVTMWQSVLAVTPDNYRAHNNLGYAYDQLDMFQDAERHYKRALGLRRFEVTENNYGVMLTRLGRPEEGVELLKTATRVRPQLTKPWANLAVALAAIGENDDAVAAADKALELDSTLAQAHLALGIVFARRGDGARAEASFQRAIALQDRAAPIGYGQLLVDQNRFDEAIVVLKTAVDAQPRNTPLLVELAYADFKKGGDGRPWVDQATDIDPRWPIRAAETAWQLATHPNPKRRDGAQAWRLCQRARLGMNADNSLLLDTLAAAEAELGRYADAVATAQRAHERAAKDRDPLESAIQGRLSLYQRGQPFRGARDLRQ